jgi:hypothetical protein
MFTFDPPRAPLTSVGFKKNVNRATTQVMMKTGHVEKTNDRDYEVEERSVRNFLHRLPTPNQELVQPNHGACNSGVIS